MKKKLVIGILAHVDAGKTTLAESLLYLSGRTARLGRVDNKDAYLDTYELERARGITIFSKQAVFDIGDLQITLLDTPGHVDFSAEMERTLQVLDYAVLVVSGADGVQGHTMTLWRLLELYGIPVFLFINKMDQPAADRERLLREIKKQLDPGCIDFGQADGSSLHDQTDRDAFFEQLAMSCENLMDTFLETGRIEKDQIGKAIADRFVFPCYFGSALRLDGIEPLMDGIAGYAGIPAYPGSFGAKVFKISRDEQGNRLTHMKITGGSLRVRDAVKTGAREEKINQIRIYSGQKYEAVNEISAGSVCAVTGLSQPRAGEGLGIEKSSDAPVLEPVLSYQIKLPDGMDPRAMIPKLRVLEEEAPELHIVWDEQLQEIQAEIMGEVQIEILQSLIRDRFGAAVMFDSGKIVYKETIAGIVEGVGHFEPLRHYAEVHLLLAPGEPGSGVQIGTVCSEDVLGGNWQGSILSSLEEKEHKGVLTGSVVTDIKITLVTGRAHNKHTEGGDFREAACRAVRQGLMEAASVLLEPYYSFQLELPEKLVGKAMTDIEKMNGSCAITGTDGETAILSGIAPVAAMRNYQQEVTAYAKGLGRLSCSLMGYAPCGNAQEVVAQIGYDPDRDTVNPSGSVFCAGGSGFLVEWNEVKEHMHVEAFLKESKSGSGPAQRRASSGETAVISQEEIDQIMNRTFYANQGKKSAWKRRIAPRERHYEAGSSSSGPNDIAAPAGRSKEPREEYLLVDGYNIIHAWPELSELADGNMDGARMKLIDSLSNYQGIRKCQIIAVFDAYRVQGHREEIMDFHNIHLVFTREAQTADQYIEKFAHDNQKKYQITVATSDGMQQMIVRGAGCSLMSARELKTEIDDTNTKLMEEYRKLQGNERSQLADNLPEEVRRQMEALLENRNNL